MILNVIRGGLAAILVMFLTHSEVHATNGYTERIAVRKLLSVTRTQAGGPIVYPQNGQAEVTMLSVEIPPGGQTGWHWHPVPGFAYVESGTLTVTTTHGAKSFPAGTAFAEMVGVPHNGRNYGKAPVRLIVLFTGVKNHRFVVPR